EPLRSRSRFHISKPCSIRARLSSGSSRATSGSTTRPDQDSLHYVASDRGQVPSNHAAHEMRRAFVVAVNELWPTFGLRPNCVPSSKKSESHRARDIVGMTASGGSRGGGGLCNEAYSRRPRRPGSGKPHPGPPS